MWKKNEIKNGKFEHSTISLVRAVNNEENKLKKFWDPDPIGINNVRENVSALTERPFARK